MQLKLRLLFLIALGGTSLVTLAACGGGGGGGGGGTPVTPATATPTPTSYAQIPPPGPAQTQVLTLALGSGATAMGYDADDNLVLLGVGSNVINAQDSHFVALAPDGGIITALGYSTSAHQIVFSTASDVYECTLSGVITKLAGGFGLIEALTVAPNGSIYVIDTDHVSTIGSGGSVILITNAGTIGYNPNYNAPGIAFDSANGTIIVADAANDVIDSITTGGQVSVLAGSCKQFQGSCWRIPIPGSGAAANFGTPNGAVFDSANGTIYVADSTSNDLWAVSGSGAAAPVAGYGAPINYDDYGLAAFLDQPFVLAYQPNTQSVDILQATQSAQQAVTAYSTIGSTPPGFVYPATPAYVNAYAIATAPDSSAWAADAGGAAVDRIQTNFNVNTYATAATVQPEITVDGSGNAWALVGGGLLEVTPAGAQTFVAAQPSMVSVTFGAGGNPWFTTSDTPAYGGSFGFVATGSSNAVTQFAISQVPGAIAPAANNEMAFVVNTNAAGTTNSMSFANTSGSVLGTFAMKNPAQNSLAYDPVSGLDWYADIVGNISSMSESGVENDYPACASGCNPVDVTAAPSGDIYAGEGLTPTVDRLTTAHAAMLYALPLSSGEVTGVSARSDGKLWVATNQGVAYLFDPAAYDAMGGPHLSSPLSYVRRNAMREARRGTLAHLPWHRIR